MANNSLDIKEINARYFKIGSFVIIGLTLIIITIIMLTSSDLFEQTFNVETYFNESVQGLSEGSPVKYRGMTIGTVKKIDFVNEVYDIHDKQSVKQFSPYIYVRMSIVSNVFKHFSKQKEADLFEDAVKSGLRIKLAMQNLTGNAYLELNFLDPASNPALPISWTPKNIYIPSTKSTITELSDTIQAILKELKNAHIQQTIDQFRQLSKSTNKTVVNIDQLLRNNQSRINQILQNLQITSYNIRSLSDAAKTYPSQTLFAKNPKPLKPGDL